MKHELEILRQRINALKCPVSVALDEPNLLFYLSILIKIKNFLLRLKFKGSQSILCFKEVRIISDFIDFKNKAEKYKEKNSVDLNYKQQLENCIKMVLEQGQQFYNKRKNHNINLMITPGSTKRKKEIIKIIEKELFSYNKPKKKKFRF